MQVSAILQRIEKCYKYREYDTAIFLTSYISHIKKRYNLLLGIFLYLNREFFKSLGISLESQYADFIVLSIFMLQRDAKIYICKTYIKANPQ